MLPQTNIARIMAVIVSAIVTWLAAKGVDVSPDAQAAIISTVSLATYALVHRVISKFSNPKDVATSDARKAAERGATR